jgi:hypothetical protein
MGELVYFPKRPVDQLLKIVLKNLDTRGITFGEQEFYRRLAADLEAVLQKSRVVNYYDGFEIGYGEAVFWIYNRDLEQTVREVLPLFQGRVFVPGSYYVKVDKNRKVWDVVSLG